MTQKNNNNNKTNKKLHRFRVTISIIVVLMHSKMLFGKDGVMEFLRKDVVLSYAAFHEIIGTLSTVIFIKSRMLYFSTKVF